MSAWCEWCGDDHNVRRTHNSTEMARFCSRACRAAAWRDEFRREHGVSYHAIRQRIARGTPVPPELEAAVRGISRDG